MHCTVSASTGSVGRRRCPAPMSVSWTSTPPGSNRRMATAVGTVFRCVASRNRERVPLGTPTRPDGGEIRPRARPPRRVAPGRQGRQLCESRPTQPNFSAQDSPAFLRIQPPRRGERPTPPPAEGRNVRAAHFRPPLATAEKLQFESNCTHRAFYWPDGREKRAETTPAKHPTGTSGPPAKHPTGASGTPGKTPNGGQRRAIQDKQRTGFRQAAWPSGRHPAPLRTDSGRVPPVGSAPDTSSKGSGIGMPPE